MLKIVTLYFNVYITLLCDYSYYWHAYISRIYGILPYSIEIKHMFVNLFVNVNLNINET